LQPESWLVATVALLDFATAKTKERPVSKLSIATNHFISRACSTLSAGVATTDAIFATVATNQRHLRNRRNRVSDKVQMIG
jgi:hypothetical protein